MTHLFLQKLAFLIACNSGIAVPSEQSIGMHKVPYIILSCSKKNKIRETKKRKEMNKGEKREGREGKKGKKEREREFRKDQRKEKKRKRKKGI